MRIDDTGDERAHPAVSEKAIKHRVQKGVGSLFQQPSVLHKEFVR